MLNDKQTDNREITLAAVVYNERQSTINLLEENNAFRQLLKRDDI